MFGAGEGHIEAPLSATLVDGPEVHQHPALRTRPVTDAQDDDIPFIPLNILQVFHQQADELPVDLPFPFSIETIAEFGIVLGQTPQSAFNLVLLGLGESDDSDTSSTLLTQQFADKFCDVLGLGPVPSFVVDRVLHAMKADRPTQQFRGSVFGVGRLRRDKWSLARSWQAFFWNGQQSSVVEGPVRKTDQRFAATAIMPTQHGGRQILGSMIEEAIAGQIVRNQLATFLDEHFLLLVGILSRREEIGGWQLHFVSDYNCLGSAKHRRHRLFECDLTRFVENHDVEITRIHRQCLGDTEGTHQPDRLEVLNDRTRIAGHEVTNGLIAHRLAKLMLQLPAAATVLLLEFLFIAVELSSRLTGKLDVGEKPLPDSSSEIVCVTRQPLAIEALEAAGLPIADLGRETGNLPLLTICIGQAAIDDRRFDLRRPEREITEGGPNCGRCHRDLREDVQKRRQVSQRGLNLFQFCAQLFKRTVRVLAKDLVQFGSQRVQWLIRLDDPGDNLLRCGRLHQRCVNAGKPRRQVGENTTQLLDVGQESIHLAVQLELIGNRLTLRVERSGMLVFFPE